MRVGNLVLDVLGYADEEDNMNGVSFLPLNAMTPKTSEDCSRFPSPGQDPGRSREFCTTLSMYYNCLILDRESYDIAVSIGLIDPYDITFQDFNKFTEGNRTVPMPYNFTYHGICT